VFTSASHEYRHAKPGSLRLRAPQRLPSSRVATAGNNRRDGSNAISYGLALRAVGCWKEDYTRHDGCFYTHFHDCESAARKKHNRGYKKRAFIVLGRPERSVLTYQFCMNAR
jgi:hypothetical protein